METTDKKFHDILFLQLRDTWNTAGLTPLIILRLLEKGWSYLDLKCALEQIIGPDFKDIKVSEWICRLCKQGIKTMEDDETCFNCLYGCANSKDHQACQAVQRDEDGQEMSFVEIVDRVIFTCFLHAAHREEIGGLND